MKLVNLPSNKSYPILFHS